MKSHKTLIMSNLTENTWIYVDYNYTTEMYEVKKQVRGITNDEVLKSYKSEVWAHNYKAQINY
tara:strand:- start:528 stop:716 length:189 start_codon:yes stop_codon:yes gene_type:complete